MYVDHCHQLFFSLFVVWQIGQKDFFILDHGTVQVVQCTSAESQLYKLIKNSREIRIKLALKEPFIFEQALIFDAQANPGSSRPAQKYDPMWT